MSILAQFFRGSTTHLGVFYPSHYLVAMFRTLEDAEQARRSLIRAGSAEEDAIAVAGMEMQRFAREEAEHAGLWKAAMTEFSRFLGTEAAYHDHDAELASHGAAFFATFCPNQPSKAAAWEVIHPHQPIVARYYAADGVEHLIGEA